LGNNSSPTLQAIYKQVLGDYTDHKEFLWKHRGRFVHYVQTAIEANLLDAAFSRKYFRLEKLSYELNPNRDQLLTPHDLAVLADQLLKNSDGLAVETPQYFLMRLAMQLSTDKANPTREALVLYEEFSLKPTQALSKYVNN
jgi:ribonucleoside-diphosphate reductase alpha chain